MSMKVSPFPISIPAPFSMKSHSRKLHRFKPITILPCKASIIPPPPPDFDFRNEILGLSTAVIAETHPELLDLAHNGALVIINKTEYGPVPSWRSGFVEPDSIWLIGTTHTSQESVSDVERVIRAVRPDNIVVELCRSRQVLLLCLELTRIFVEILLNIAACLTGGIAIVARSAPLPAEDLSASASIWHFGSLI